MSTLQTPFGTATWDMLFPGVAALNFSRNCTTYAHFLSTIMMPDPFESSQYLYGGYAAGVDAYTNALPYWNDTLYSEDSPNATTTDYYAQISYWISYELYFNYDETTNMNSPDDRLWDKLINASVDCPSEYCKAIGYTSNADLTGIGVVISYYFEAVLATIYLIAYTVWSVRGYFRKRRGPYAGTPRPQVNRSRSGQLLAKLSLGRRVLEAFQGSLDGFLSGAMLIAIAMLGAAVFVSASRLLHPRDIMQVGQIMASGSDIYDIALSFLGAAFSVFPVMLLYALMRHPERSAEGGNKTWLKRGVLLIIWILGVVECFLAPRGELDYKFRHESESQFTCDLRGGPRYWNGLKAAEFLVVGVPLLWLALTVFVLTGFRIPGLVKQPWVKRWRAVWRLVVAWINMLAMWGILIYFTILRQAIIDVADGADTGAQKWSFGQILAIATWVPVIAEFFYIFFFGIEDGMASHLPPDFHVTRDADTDVTRTLPMDSNLDVSGAGRPQTANGPGFPVSPPGEKVVGAMAGVQPVAESPAWGQERPGQEQSLQYAYGYQQVHSPAPLDSGMTTPEAVSQQRAWNEWNRTGW